MSRTARLSIMLTEETKKELKEVSQGMGMTESALGAYVIGQWLFTQRQVNTKMMAMLGSAEVAQMIKTAAEQPTNTALVDRP